jgi:golgin subfamily B member 1
MTTTVHPLPETVTDEDFTAHLKELDAAEAELDNQLALQAGKAPAGQQDDGDGEEKDGEASTNNDETQVPEDGKAEPEADKKDKPAEGKKDDAKPEEGKVESGKDQKKQSKYEKDKERYDRNFKKLNEEQSTLRKDREEFEKQKQEFEAQRKKAGEPEFTPEEYEKQAATLEGEARQLENLPERAEEYEEKKVLARMARAEAKKLRDTPGKSTQLAEQRLKQEHESAWVSAANEMPQIKDSASVLRSEVVKLLKTEPQILESPKGPYYATKIAHLQLQSAKVPELETQVKSLTQEVEKLRKATSIAGGGTTQIPKAKRFEDMSPSEQEKELIAIGEAADRGEY